MLNKAIIGKKVGMTQIFDADGKVIPVTVIEAGPCIVTQVKTVEKEGYAAVQLGFEDVKEKKLNKPELGHLKKAGAAVKKHLREFRFEDCSMFQPGDEIKADMFAVGDYVDVTGTSKGKGFAGTIKRWHFHQGPMSHGSKNHRRPASSGAKGPARTFKGKHSPGQMGGNRVTVQNLEIVRVDVERNLLLVKGAVPGPKKGLVYVKSAVKSAAQE